MKITKQGLLVFLLMISLPLDYVNGLVSNFGYNLPISQLFKSFFLIVFMLSNRRVFPFLLNCFLMMYILMSYLRGQNLNYLINYCKFIYFVNLYIYSSKINLSKERILEIFKYLFYFLFIVLILGKFGFGKPMYSSGIGTKAFFIAGNELSVTYIVLFGLIYISKPSCLNIILGLLIAILLQTKVAILGFILILTLLALLNFKKKLILLALFLVYILNLFLDKLSFYKRFLWYLENKGIFQSIFSGREIKIKELSANSKKIFNFFGNIRSEYFLSESDLFDTYYFYGIINCIIIMAMIYLIYKNINKNGIFLITLIVIIGLLWGHVFYSSLLATYFVAGIKYFKKEMKKNDKNINNSKRFKCWWNSKCTNKLFE